MPSELSAAMADIVKSASPLLQRTGFKKRRHSFNRAMKDGVVHVVYFWMAPSEPPAWTEVPGLRERLYGNFRLDFGVWVPEMNRMGAPGGAWINEYNCHLRRTIGQLTGRASDQWWPITDADAAETAANALQSSGLPWLDNFRSKSAILGAFENQGPLALGMTPAGPLDIADLYQALDRPGDSRRTLEAYIRQPVNMGHAEYLRGYLSERGHPDLAALVHTTPPVVAANS